jgi:hypothetical protein
MGAFASIYKSEAVPNYQHELLFLADYIGLAAPRLDA